MSPILTLFYVTIVTWVLFPQDFRNKVSDVIKDVVFIVGSSHCFKQMFLLLQEPNTTWESSEAALFVMENVAKNILP